MTIQQAKLINKTIMKTKQNGLTVQKRVAKSFAQKLQWQKFQKAGIEAMKKKYAKMTKKEKSQSMKKFQRAALKATQKRWDSMTKKEKWLASRAFQEAGTKAMSEKRAKMTKKEKKECLRPWFEAGAKASQLANPSSIEKMIWRELDKLKIKYKTQVCFSKFIVDIYIPTWRLIIECNGTYWHNYEIFSEKKIRDETLEKYASEKSYKIIWLQELDIRKNPKQALAKGLKRKKELNYDYSAN